MHSALYAWMIPLEFRATGKAMKKNDVLARIAQEAQTYHLPADTALSAYADILAELAGRIDADDLEALIAIGTVLMRLPEPVTPAHPDSSEDDQWLRLVPSRPR
jgi:hypothetical protein